jgi:hypothetical protein
MSIGARFVIEQFNEIVRPDGGSLRLLAVDGPTLRVAYAPGVNEQCESCVIGAEDLADMLREALRQHDPSIAHVVVETPS